MIFGDLIKLAEAKLEKDNNVIDSRGVELVDFVNKTEQGKWYKFVKDDVYLVYNKHYLNMTKLHNEIITVYSLKGYIGLGMSKLSIEQLLRYSGVRLLIKPFFLDINQNIDPNVVANMLLRKEYI
jgi:hypothetical protein